MDKTKKGGRRRGRIAHANLHPGGGRQRVVIRGGAAWLLAQAHGL